MASIFTSGVFEGFDSNGDPLASGKLYTYAAGTTTPLATYTNQGGATPNANPVVLDSAGRANVWLGSSAYRLLLKTSADVTVWDTDNVRSAAFDSAALSASTGSSLVGHIASGAGAVATTVQTKLRESVSVKDFGAVGDGVADDTAAWVAALTAHDHVYGPQGSYAISQLVITNAFGKKITFENKETYFIGTVAGTSVLRFGASTGGSSADTTKRAQHCCLENVTILATAAYTYGIECQWLTDSSFNDVVISSGGAGAGNMIDTGMFIDFSWDNDFNHLSITGKNGIVSGGFSPNRNTYHGLRLAGGGLGGTGIDIAGSGNSAFGFDISAYTTGVKTTLGGYGIVLSGGYFESNETDILFSGSSIHGVSITGNVFLAGLVANVGITQSGAGTIYGVSVTGNSFRSKTDAIILTAKTSAWAISGNSYPTCTRTITEAGARHLIEDGGSYSLVGGQLKFPATQVPSSDVNTLDDYEEGTFTPVANSMTEVLGGGSVTYSGRYVKVGKLVFYSILVDAAGGATTASGAGTTHFTGMPFNAANFAAATGTLLAVDGAIASLGNGLVSHSGVTRAYTPTWTARTSDIFINGVYEAAA